MNDNTRRLRILLWNCCNGISQKAQIDYFEAFKPDIAVIPELKQGNVATLKPESSVWITNNHSNPSPKGLGVLAYNGYQLTELPRDDEMEIFIPLKASRADFTFTLLAVWNFYSACKQGRFKDVKGKHCLEFCAMKHYLPILRDPTLIVGDWNLGPTFAKGDFLEILRILGENGIKSLYHEHYGLHPETSANPTFRSTRNSLHHLDHMFGSKYFYENMNGLQIDSFENVVLSDHAPLLLEINTQSIASCA